MTEPAAQRAGRGELITDIVLAAVILLLALLGLPVLGVTGGVPLLGLLALPAGALLAVAVLLRRIAPPWSLAIAWAAAVLQLVLPLPPIAPDLGVLMVLYAVAAYGGRGLRIAGVLSIPVGALLAGVHLALLDASTAPPSGGVLSLPRRLAEGTVPLGEALIGITLVLLALLGAWLAGLLRRSVLAGRREELARRLAVQQAQAEQERGRIAREMHDVVAHSLAVVIAQADGARYLAERDPGAAQQALAAIAGAARAALIDVRGLLAELRHRADPGPQPGLTELPALFAQLREAELELRVQEHGDRPLGWPPGRQLAAYRILQEALTNALRHGRPGGPVAVELDWRADPVRLRVRNPLPAAGEQGVGGAPRLQPGHGLIGMAERAALAGGALRTAVAGDGFELIAELPGAAAQEPAPAATAVQPPAAEGVR